MPNPTVWLNAQALDAMTAEARRAHPNETGGMLVGWDNPARHEIVIATIIGPGPNASRTKTTFEPDSAAQQAQLEHMFNTTDGAITYLGDWHVHPAGGFGMSRRDRKTMAATARHPDAQQPQPLMGLLARTADSPQGYRTGVWRWDPLHPPFRRSAPVLVTDLRVWTPTVGERFWG